MSPRPTLRCPRAVARRRAFRLTLLLLLTGGMATGVGAQPPRAPAPASARADSVRRALGDTTRRAGDPPIDHVDHAELARLYQADQADRTPPPGAPRDFFVGLEARDAARRRAVLALYTQGALRTGPDYFRAAMILQHGTQPDDYLRAHELALAALALGEERARWLTAASLDRFLLSVGRPQRFGTQQRFDAAAQRFAMDSVQDGVTDALRQVLRVRPLAEARADVDATNRQLETRRAPATRP